MQGKAVVARRAVLLQRLPHRLRPLKDVAAQLDPLLEWQRPQALGKACAAGLLG